MNAIILKRCRTSSILHLHNVALEPQQLPTSDLRYWNTFTVSFFRCKILTFDLSKGKILGQHTAVFGDKSFSPSGSTNKPGFFKNGGRDEKKRERRGLQNCVKRRTMLKKRSS
ncbi:hypothetical protein TNCV_1075041 [Trichonephila clavipes]|uniref:Uncharacterized protein n=1 Tax=Trichonephila clavipes TaxID=2585209 RepID=A0A8X6VQR9_TRICX|nr:hypothetical protein TNCV_1075041 [Trichonephila clavipes]